MNISDLISSANKSSILFKGSGFTLQLQDEKKSLIEARTNKIPTINFRDCENTLKELGKIDQFETLYSLNVMIDDKSENQMNNTIYSNMKINSIIIDSKANVVNTSLCDKFELRSPINPNLINISKYDEIKEKLGYNIFNSSDEMFVDFCKPFPSDNNTDLTLSDRKLNYNVSVLCPENMIFLGFDEHSNSICKSTSPPKYASTDLKHSVFSPISESNFKLIKCFSTTFTKDIVKTFGFYIFLSISILSVSINALHFMLIKIESNTDLIFEQDGITVMPKQSGIFNVNQNLNKPSNKINIEMVNEKVEYNSYDNKSNYNDILSINHFNNNISSNIQNCGLLENKSNVNNNNSIGDIIEEPGHISHSQISNPINDNIDVLVNNLKVEDKLKHNNIASYNSNNEIINNENSKSEKNQIVDFKNIKEINIEINTKNDLNHLPYILLLKFDKRSFCAYFKDEVIHKVEILDLIITRSILNPFFLRLNKFLFMTNLEFCLNAMFMSSNSIETQSKEKNLNGPSSVGVKFMLLNQFMEILYSSIISIFISKILDLIVRIPEGYLNDFNEKILMNNEEARKEAM